MNITIYGAGAVGGLLAARLAGLANCHVSLIARGATRTAIAADGLQLRDANGSTTHRLRVESDPVCLGVQDLVILTVKATGLAEVAPHIAPLLGPQTTVISAMNGVPWWFFADPKVPYGGLRLQSLDPDGRLELALPLSQLLGCVVHLSCSAPAPGVVQAGFGNRLILGEACGGPSPRLTRTVALFAAAGFETETSLAIRQDIWYKLWGNMTMNPLSAITGATGDRILDDVLVREYCLRAMGEAAAIGVAIGCPIAQSGEERMLVTRKLGAFRTSMLQDVDAGKPLELDALVGAVQEIGQKVGIATPTIDSLLGLARLFGRSHGLYPE